ncbi:ABC transporter substrate-binding protein [Flavobacterium sp. J27]|uniref:ABC transporter substrate-binding protein n=1 Tax=Flavobacterium sp. J27 TaxID=2060419 RepID=UPI00102FA457|nr:ABC transporter substrate-binding protein [Flavobacterium sp. J27]
MKFAYRLLLLLPFLLIGCKETTKNTSVVSQSPKNKIQYASGLAIYKYNGYSVVKVLNPWPKAEKPFTYILKQQNVVIPDSLKDYTMVTVPLQKLVVTSTTIIPFLEMLDSETKLIGFPHTNYISSTKTRALIDSGKVRDVGQNESLNIELLFDMQPDAIVTFGVDNTNPMVDKLTSNGLNVLFQGDWMEQSPLGKAEWIKFYAALLGKEKKGDSIFNSITNNYQQTLTLVKDFAPKQKVLYGSLYKDQWFVARGNSWIAQFIQDAKADYLWKDLPGMGSEPLSFESVFDTAEHADIWITNGSIMSLDQLLEENHHYAKFDAFQHKNVYSFESQKGATGGTVYYESAPSRPDLVLKDYIKIFHPTVLPNYTFTFAKKLD